VVRNDFRPPEALDHTDVDLWIPLSSFHQSLIRPEAFFVRVLARVREPATLFAAREELELWRISRSRCPSSARGNRRRHRQTALRAVWRRDVSPPHRMCQRGQPFPRPRVRSGARAVDSGGLGSQPRPRSSTGTLREFGGSHRGECGWDSPRVRRAQCIPPNESG
jgi:hypothetical protein